mmetsp:Transcript_73051/g.171720  ORF Transcript_73051/g.171720 Transcript_73051/m.171720 type:complete len:222 (-) Transcript_73051:142-807(-)
MGATGGRGSKPLPGWWRAPGVLLLVGVGLAVAGGVLGKWCATACSLGSTASATRARGRYGSSVSEREGSPPWPLRISLLEGGRSAPKGSLSLPCPGLDCGAQPIKEPSRLRWGVRPRALWVRLRSPEEAPRSFRTKYFHAASNCRNETLTNASNPETRATTWARREKAPNLTRSAKRSVARTTRMSTAIWRRKSSMVARCWKLELSRVPPSSARISNGTYP